MPANASQRSFPVYQVSRLTTELHLTGVANLRVLSPGRYERGILLIALARHGLPDWFAGNRLRRPKTLTCFTSINSLAVSMGRSFETVRRHIRALVEEGIVVEDARGVAIGTDAAVAKRLIAYLRLAHDTLLGLAADLAGMGLLPRCPAPSRKPVTRAIMAAALDVQLMPIEALRDPMPDWMVMLIWGVIDGLCVRHVTTDPDLSAHYARDPTPDEERRPVPLSLVAALSGQPYPSVWRHAKALEARGAIRAKNEGYIVSTDYLHAPAMRERVIATTGYYLRRLAELVRQGFDPSRPMPWLGERPPLATEPTS